MFRLTKPVLAAALIALRGVPAFAADIVEPAPPPVYQSRRRISAAGIFAATSTIIGRISRGVDYITYGVTCCGLPDPGSNSFDFGEPDGAFSLGAGVGYQITNYLRTDLTADYWFDSDFTARPRTPAASPPSDTSSWSAWLLLANAYADLGTCYGFTPYIGAGIGGAHIDWDDLHNTIAGVTTVHEGADDWRFAWALMAGTAYCLTDNLKLDVGYRYSHSTADACSSCRRSAPAAPALASTMVSTCMRCAAAFATSSAATPAAACLRPLRARAGHADLQVTRSFEIATARHRRAVQTADKPLALAGF